MINNLRKINDKLMSLCQNKEDSRYIKLSLIKEILNDEQCFFKMNIEESLSVLYDLGYRGSEAIEVYKELIRYNYYYTTKMD